MQKTPKSRIFGEIRPIFILKIAKSGGFLRVCGGFYGCCPFLPWIFRCFCGGLKYCLRYLFRFLTIHLNSIGVEFGAVKSLKHIPMQDLCRYSTWIALIYESQFLINVYRFCIGIYLNMAGAGVFVGVIFLYMQ